METDTALVGADSAIHLHAVALIDHNLAIVGHPRNSEHYDTLRLSDALQHLHLNELGILQYIGSYALNNLTYGLMKLGLIGVLCHHVSHKLLDVLFNCRVHNRMSLLINYVAKLVKIINNTSVL